MSIPPAMGSCPTSPAGLAYYDPAAMRRQLAFPGPPWAINYELASLSDGLGFRGVIRGELADLFGADPPPRMPEGAILAYVVGAYLSLLTWWVNTEAPISPEQMDRIFQTLVTPSIRAATTPLNLPRRATATAPTRGQR
jgi:hypothetical protein